MAERSDIIMDSESAVYSELLELTEEISPQDFDKLYSIFKERTNINILVVGKTGVGKTTLISSLLPDKVEKVHGEHGAASAKHPFLQKYHGQIQGGSVTLYDTRGYCSATTTKADADRLAKEVLKKFSPRSKEKLDLVIFCQDMFERFDEASLIALKFFGRLMTEETWKYSIVALTKANFVPASVKRAKNPKLEMLKTKEGMRKEMREKYFSQNGLLNIFEDIPFVPVGYDAEVELLTTDNSINDLIEKCIIRCNPESFSIVVASLLKERVALGAGIAGAGLGAAGVGALIGGLLGLPFGGVGAAPGAAIGAIVGGAIGGGGAATVIGVKSAIQVVVLKVLKTAEELGLFRRKKAISMKKLH